MIKVNLLALFCLNCFSLSAQKDFCTKLDKFIDSIKTPVHKVVTSVGFKHSGEKKINHASFTIIPYCILSKDTILNEKDIFNFITISKDKAAITNILNFANDSLVVMPSRSLGVAYINQDVSITDGFHQDRMFQMFQYAKKYSKHVFLLNIDYGYLLSKCMVMAYVDNNKLKVLAYKGEDKLGNMVMDKYATLEEFIIARYGSFQGYSDIMKGKLRDMNP